MVVWPLALLLLASPVVGTETELSDLSESVILLSSHPSIEYFPESDCFHRTLWWCSGRGYSWGDYDYRDEHTGLFRSFALVTNQHNNHLGNHYREIIATLPPGTHYSDEHLINPTNQSACPSSPPCFGLRCRTGPDVGPRVGATRAMYRGTSMLRARCATRVLECS